MKLKLHTDHLSEKAGNIIEVDASGPNYDFWKQYGDFVDDDGKKLSKSKVEHHHGQHVKAWKEKHAHLESLSLEEKNELRRKTRDARLKQQNK